MRQAFVHVDVSCHRPDLGINTTSQFNGGNKTPESDDSAHDEPGNHGRQREPLVSRLQGPAEERRQHRPAANQNMERSGGTEPDPASSPLPFEHRQ